MRGSLAAGAAAFVTSMPGMGGLLATAENDSADLGAASTATSAEVAPSLGQPIVAHIVDLSTGEINLYQGTAQVIARNPGLAQALAKLAAPRG
ncbi:MAG TPA: hypothetical protein VK425_06280 [Acidimicrobiales bacterium]|nr:hypothetical protein [Acidimicrobiales bacterium]